MQMLLLEGDDMNQKTGICILLCLVLLLVFGIWYQKQRSKLSNVDITHYHINGYFLFSIEPAFCNLQH